MTEPALRSNEVEAFRATISGLDETGFKREVVKLATAQPGNLKLRDAIALIAADAFGDVGRQTVLQVFEGMRTQAQLLARAEGIKADLAKPKQVEAKVEPAPVGPRPMVWINGRPYSAAAVEEHRRKREASFILPAPQPEADPQPKDTPRKAIVAKYIKDHRDDFAAAAVPKPKPEVEELEEEPAEEPTEKPEEKSAEAAEGEIITSTQIALPITSTAAKAVALLNQKHHVIGNYGNKCVILSWELWEINRNVMIPTFQRFEDFKHRYMNRYVSRQTDEGSTKVPAGKFWLNHPDRKTYDSVAFRPNKPIVLSGNRLNLWRGFGVFPRKGSWKLMHDHIYDVLGAGDPKAGLYIERWLAYTVQHPDVVGETVLVLQGDEGTGKGTLARAMLKIFGPHGLPISQPKHLVGGFSGHLHYCCFLFLDEAFWAGDVQAEGRLKSLITEDTVTIEPKYFAPFQVPNLLHILMSSNSDWVVPAGPHARRYAVFKVSDKRIDDFDYFSALRSELDNGGIEAMLYDLLRLDLGNWRPRKIYKTAALTEQKAHKLVSDLGNGTTSGRGETRQRTKKHAIDGFDSGVRRAKKLFKNFPSKKFFGVSIPSIPSNV